MLRIVFNVYLLPNVSKVKQDLGQQVAFARSSVGAQPTICAAEYSKVPEVTLQHPPRLFCLSDAVTGGKGVATEEILHFAQSDLSTGDVMLLDTYAEVWI